MIRVLFYWEEKKNGDAETETKENNRDRDDDVDDSHEIRRKEKKRSH